MRICFSNSLLSVSLLSALGLTGCTMVNSATPSPQTVKISGTVFGGSLPIKNAKVYLYAANTTGNAGPGIAASTANASSSLLLSASNTQQDSNGNYYVLTNNSGGFALGGDFAPCTTGQELYIYSNGGDSGLGNNSAAGLMAALGACQSDYSNTHVRLNEMNTVAAAYALAGYATDATHISDDEGVTSNPNQVYAQAGMAVAFANAANLAALGTGSALSTTPGGNGTVPTATLNTLADILADCVQNSGPSSIPCSDLFTFTGTPTGGDTATAAIKLAQNPVGVAGSSASISTLYNEIAPNASFIPTLSTPPNDLTVAISYTGGLSSPGGVAVDAAGNIWATDFLGNALVKFSAAGAAYTSTNYPLPTISSQPSSVAIDGSGDIWVADSNSNALTEFVGSGNSYTGTDFTGGGLNGPYGVAVDASGNVYASNSNGNSVSHFTGSGGVYVAAFPETGGNLSVPQGIALDATGNVWVSSLGNASVAEFQPPLYAGTQNQGSSLGNPQGLAIDGGGNIWVTDFTSNAVDVFTAAQGGGYNSSAYLGGGLSTPEGVAIDGAGNVWVANNGAGSISAFSNAGIALSPATSGYTSTSGASGGTSGPLAGTTSIAVDGSGNVWVSDSNDVVVQFVGAAAPVVTPLAQGIASGALGVRP